jgi:hypothetical protein
LLEDNLMKRRQELLDEGVLAKGDARGWGQGGATTGSRGGTRILNSVSMN